MRKSIIGIIMAVALVGASIAFPVQAYADYIPENSDSVFNNSDDIIGNNSGTVMMNFGTVKNNNSEGTVDINLGTVENNNGTVKDNSEGTVKDNFGTVDNNSGTVKNNNSGGTVDNNLGTVEINYGTVVNNFDRVEKNDGGTVVNNFGGDVYGGTVTNQWYEYILTGGRYIDISKQTTTGDNRTWIGQAGSTDNVLGDFYITVAANDGMTFDYATINGGRVQGITNADGSISFGNICSAISIFFKRFINNNNNNNAGEENTNNSSDSDTNNADMMATIESIIANEEAMPVTSFISDEAVAKMPEAAKSTGASYNLSVITSSQGFMAAINKISEVVKAQNAVNNAGGRITSATIYSEKPMLFTADVLNAISASDIDFVFVFMHNGKMYKVTIPRGAKIDFTGHACEGPLYFGKILGTTEEIG